MYAGTFLIKAHKPHHRQVVVGVIMPIEKRQLRSTVRWICGENKDSDPATACAPGRKPDRAGRRGSSRQPSTARPIRHLSEKGNVRHPAELQCAEESLTLVTSTLDLLVQFIRPHLRNWQVLDDIKIRVISRGGDEFRIGIAPKSVFAVLGVPGQTGLQEVCGLGSTEYLRHGACAPAEQPVPLPPPVVQ